MILAPITMDNGLFLGRSLKYVQEMSELINYALTHSVCYQMVVSLGLAPTYYDSFYLGASKEKTSFYSIIIVVIVMIHLIQHP